MDNTRTTPEPTSSSRARHHYADRRRRLARRAHAHRDEQLARPSPARSSPPQEAPHEQDPPGDRRRRQLRQLPIQGLEYYKDADPSDEVPGLMHVVLGGYHIRDIELVAAFDVDAEKVGLDAGKAIWASKNNTVKFAKVSVLGVTVMRGPTLDGFGEFYRETCEESPAAQVDVAQVLRDTRTDVLVSYLPVGSEEAQRYYAQACLDSKTAFVNAIPVFIASDSQWAAKFEEAGVPIIGDDIKSQVGARPSFTACSPACSRTAASHRPHLPAERRRQHGLQEHARTEAPKVQENLKDAIGHQPDRPRHLRRQRPHRP